MGEFKISGAAGSIEQKIHTIRAATRDVGDGTCKFIFGITEDLLPQLAKLQENLSIAREALELFILHEQNHLDVNPDVHRHDRYRENVYEKCCQALEKIL